MARVKGPLYALSASGLLAHTLAYNDRPEGPSVTAFKPAPNPNTTQQQRTRAALRLASLTWQQLPALLRLSWQAEAHRRASTPRARYMARNVPIYRSNNSSFQTRLYGHYGIRNQVPQLTIQALSNHRVRGSRPTLPTVPGYTTVGYYMADRARQLTTNTDSPPIYTGQDLTAPIQITLTHPIADTWDGTVALRLTRQSDGADIWLPAQTYAVTT